MPNIMLCEDDSSIRLVMCLFLVSEGFTVCTVSNGIEALAMLDICQPDLILADWIMPYMDGEALLQSLVERGNTIPVCVVAASDYRARALELGAKQFLLKPFELDDLLAMIEQHTRQEVPA